MNETRPDLPLAERVSTAAWYQTIRLPGDIVTPGNFDTVAQLEQIPFPKSLEGARCLDVGTADGFWAFEMERRGASEVVAIDVRDPSRMDWPGRPKSDVEMRTTMRPDIGEHSFDIAHQALRSHVQWRELSVYEIAPELLGEFDFVFMGSLLLHLRDPVAALAKIASVLRGELLSVDALSLLLSALHPKQPVARLEARGWPMWWALNLAAYRHIFGAAGLEIRDRGRPFFLKGGPGYAAMRSRRQFHRYFQDTIVTRLGVPHAWVRAYRNIG